jgi:hypothetical protein
MDNGAIGFFIFFVILIIIWIFAMGGCVRERNSLEGYGGITDGWGICQIKCRTQQCRNKCNQK